MPFRGVRGRSAVVAILGDGSVVTHGEKLDSVVTAVLCLLVAASASCKRNSGDSD